MTIIKSTILALALGFATLTAAQAGYYGYGYSNYSYNDYSSSYNYDCYNY